MTLQQLQYPIGKFQKPETITTEIINQSIKTIASFPEKIYTETYNLSNSQLDTSYRPNGWTIRQVVHHCADSHCNSFIRLKLALTENQPTIKPYLENLWANLQDSVNMPLEPSIQMLSGIHHRWSTLLHNLTQTDLQRTFIHPEHGQITTIQEHILQYAWHCNHHLAHITQAKKNNQW